MQTTWLTTIKWDEKLPADINTKFIDWKKDLLNLNDFIVERKWFCGDITSKWKCTSMWISLTVAWHQTPYCHNNYHTTNFFFWNVQNSLHWHSPVKSLKDIALQRKGETLPPAISCSWSLLDNHRTAKYFFSEMRGIVMAPQKSLKDIALQREGEPLPPATRRSWSLLDNHGTAKTTAAPQIIFQKCAA